jgi:hypothetical protein
VPVEGMKQLPDLDFESVSTLFDSPPFIIWSDPTCRWTAQGTRNEAAYYAAWDAERREWIHGGSLDSGVAD